jgi:hypothetical protein
VNPNTRFGASMAFGQRLFGAVRQHPFTARRLRLHSSRIRFGRSSARSLVAQRVAVASFSAFR